jgi:Fe-S-cluster containining protein
VNDDLANTWLSAARRPEVRAELEAVFTLIADQVEARRPVCVASGRCCHFEQYGHRLYVTGLEAAYTLLRLPDLSLPALTRAGIDAARLRGDCPFLLSERCTAHTIKPTGCRIYFCDPAAEEWQQELSERSLALIRAIHDRHAIPYRYGEWRSMLELLV